VAEREFESTLASIRDSQRAISGAEARAADAERRAAVALAEAEEERRRARSERRVAAAEARRQAEVALAAIEAEIAELRGSLARETLTEARLDQALARIESRSGLLPAAEEPTTADAPSARRWKVGDRALAASGWNGSIVALDEARGRATLEVGGLRVDVPLDELGQASASGPALVPTRTASGGAASAATPRSGRRGDFGPLPRSTSGTGTAVRTDAARPRTGDARRSVASSLDLRGARVEEALELLDRYVDDAARAEAGRVTIVHGHGSGAMRDAVRQALGTHPLVREWRPGERGEGGDGATIVSF
jgi:DNA mismatch repair protein MutS2